jgi:hypothetical protein
MSRTNDTGLLLAGAAAFVALVAYLAVAFVLAGSSPAVVAAQRTVANPAQMLGPWRARDARLARISRTRGRRLAVRVTPLKSGLYGAEVQQLAVTPAMSRGFTLSFRVRGRTPRRLLVQINTGALNPPIRYLAHTTVVAGRKWHRFTYHGRLRGLTGLGLFVGQETSSSARRWFEIRDLSVRAARR